MDVREIPRDRECSDPSQLQLKDLDVIWMIRIDMRSESGIQEPDFPYERYSPSFL